MGLIDLSFVVPPYLKFTSLHVSNGCIVPERFVTESEIVSSSFVVGIFFTLPIKIDNVSVYCWKQRESLFLLN